MLQLEELSVVLHVQSELLLPVLQTILVILEFVHLVLLEIVHALKTLLTDGKCRDAFLLFSSSSIALND